MWNCVAPRYNYVKIMWPQLPQTYYRPQTKLREGNVFTFICLPTGGWWKGSVCAGWPEEDPPPPPSGPEAGSGSHWSRRYSSYCNASLLVHVFVVDSWGFRGEWSNKNLSRHLSWHTVWKIMDRPPVYTLCNFNRKYQRLSTVLKIENMASGIRLRIFMLSEARQFFKKK